MSKKSNKKVIELVKGKTRKEEEKLFLKFSETQLTGILLLILAATFLTQGIISYLELINKAEAIKTWFIIILTTLVFLISSIILTNLGSVIAPLKFKRVINVGSFTMFILGAFSFLIALFYVLFLI